MTNAMYGALADAIDGGLRHRSMSNLTLSQSGSKAMKPGKHSLRFSKGESRVSRAFKSASKKRMNRGEAERARAAAAAVV